MDFPDAPATDSTEPYTAQLAPAADWMGSASYGRLRLENTPLRRWVRMPADSTSYGFARGLTFEAHEKYLQDAVTAADPYADFSRYDMVYVVPTRTATAIPFSPTYLYDPATPGVTADGTRLKWAVTFGQDMWHWGHKVAAHESAHTFGLPDLYAFTGATHRYVGGWDVMGDIAGPAPQYLGWHSWKLGWTRDDQVACLPASGRRMVRLTPVERPGGTKIAVLRTGGTTAYVAESRRAQGSDAAACSTGVLIYAVDSAARTGEGPVQIMNANPATTPAMRLHSAGPGRVRTGTELHRPRDRRAHRRPRGRSGGRHGAAEQGVTPARAYRRPPERVTAAQSTTGRDLRPRVRRVRRHSSSSSGTARRKPGKRVTSARRAISASARARGAPRHRWIP